MNTGELALRKWFKVSGIDFSGDCECFHEGENFLVVLYSFPAAKGPAYGVMAANVRRSSRTPGTRYKFRIGARLYVICSQQAWYTKEEAVARYMKWLARAGL